jgi:hypothetical protein
MFADGVAQIRSASSAIPATVPRATIVSCSLTSASRGKLREQGLAQWAFGGRDALHHPQRLIAQVTLPRPGVPTRRALVQIRPLGGAGIPPRFCQGFPVASLPRSGPFRGFKGESQDLPIDRLESGSNRNHR